MSEASTPKGWFHSLPAVLTALAALVGAVATLMGAFSSVSGSERKEPLGSTATAPSATDTAADGCTPPLVPRLAVPSDRVCVSPESRKRIELENQRAAERRQAGGGHHGADTCLNGYVWREAFNGDTVCVTPERRAEVLQENATAPRVASVQ